MSKDNLRKVLLDKRLKLTAKDVEDKSLAVARRIIGSNLLHNIKTVSCYLPVKNEVDTKPIINFLVEAGVDIYLPKSFGQEYKLARFKSWNDLEKGPYGILEPKGEEVVDSSEIDLVFIPGVAFDRAGVRLGYGKGVFDRLFAKSSAKRVGLAYQLQIVDELPRENHDLIMNWIITEKEIYECHPYDETGSS